MTADLLHRAATLIRERAQAATASPWSVDLNWSEFLDQDGHGRASVTGGWPLRPRLVIEEAAVAAPDAQHIAGMSPAVALAVADLLERQAGFIERGGDFSDIEAGGDASCLAIARAYLGEDT